MLAGTGAVFGLVALGSDTLSKCALAKLELSKPELGPHVPYHSKFSVKNNTFLLHRAQRQKCCEWRRLDEILW